MNKKKKILLITDDIRFNSGIAHMGREIVMKTSKYYDWVQLAGSIKHPEKGKKIDLSEDTNRLTGNTNSSVVLYPVDGYGNPDILREIIKLEKIDAIFLITDPRYFEWIFQMENEIRKQIPIIYLNIWDNIPAPEYNREFYESCDLLMGISKNTKFINRVVLKNGEISFIDLDTGEEEHYESSQRSTPTLLKYVPHGVDDKIFFPITGLDPEFMDFKSHVFGDKEPEFVLLFNSRNIRRKNILNTIQAWKIFLDTLPKDKQEKCKFLLHTHPIDNNGTDLSAFVEYIFPEGGSRISFIPDEFLPNQMNYLYNLADGVILLSTAEGWGLSLTEALLTGTPFIATVTGGMQDQMRFIDKNGKWFTPSKELPSNNKGKLKTHGEWCFPVYPTSTSLVGSVPTPYIYDDYTTPECAANEIINLYNIGRQQRKNIGEIGRQWALSDEAGFTSEIMSNRVYESMEELFKIWKPRETFEFYKDEDYKPRKLEHKLDY